MQWKTFVCAIAFLLGIMVVAAWAQDNRSDTCNTRVVLGAEDQNNPAVADKNPAGADSLSQIKKYRFVDGGDSTVVPFKMKDHCLTIAADVNGKNTFRFLLGTGKSGCVISKKVADKLKLELFGASMFRGSAGNATTRYVKIDSLQIGNVVWYPRQFEVVDDDEKSKCIFDGFDGVLGYEFFKLLPVRISFDWKRVVIFDGTKTAFPAPGIPVEVDLKNRQAVSGMLLDGRAIEVVIDLAVPDGLVLFKDWLWAKEYYEDNVFEPDMYECEGVEGYWEVYLEFKEFSIKAGDLEISDTKSNIEKRKGRADNLISACMLFIGHRSIEAKKLSPASGLMGTGLLTDYNIFIDYPNGRMYFDKRVGTK